MSRSITSIDSYRKPHLVKPEATLDIASEEPLRPSSAPVRGMDCPLTLLPHVPGWSFSTSFPASFRTPRKKVSLTGELAGMARLAHEGPPSLREGGGGGWGNEAPEARQERVEALKALIDWGQYKVDLGRLADHLSQILL